MASRRPHTATVRLTEAQYALAKERFVSDRGMSWQKLLTAAVNAYLRGDFTVNPDGSYNVEPPGAISYVDDEEAVALEDLEDHTGRSYGTSKPRTLGTRELAELAEKRTGRRVQVAILRRLVRERFPQEENPGAGTRYHWREDDPDIVRIIDAIAAGALEEIARRGVSEAERAKRAAP